jgi:DNA-binding MarR family transcriptional regulator
LPRVGRVGERKPAGGSVKAAAVTVERELMLLIRALEALQRKRGYPLERAEFLILRTLSEGGSATVGGLARTLYLDDSTMTRQVAALEAKGLVTRAADPVDRRAGLIAATLRGESMMRETLAVRLERVAGYLRRWPAADRSAFGRLLGRLNAALSVTLGE